MNVPEVSMSWSIQNLKRLGFEPKMIIDVGAYFGEWAENIKGIYPDSFVFMIEANRDLETKLCNVKEKFPDTVDYEIAVLGAESKESVPFYSMETAGSSVLEEISPFDRKVINLPMVT